MCRLFEWQNEQIQNFFRENDWSSDDESSKKRWLEHVCSGEIHQVFLIHYCETDNCQMFCLKGFPDCAGEVFQTGKFIQIAGLNQFLCEIN